MKTSIKKGTTHISINYCNEDYSNNLYCSDIVLIKGETNILEISFKNIINARTITNSNDDLDYLKENINLLERIYIFDSTITKSLIKKLRQNEKFTLCLIIDKVYNFHSEIVFKSKEEFDLIISRDII